MTAHLDSATVPELTATESVVSAIWAELLQRPTVEPADHFFDHGGDSMMAMIVQFRVADELHVELPPGAVNEAPTLREFCALIDRYRLQEPPSIVAAEHGEEIGTL